MAAVDAELSFVTCSLPARTACSACQFSSRTSVVPTQWIEFLRYSRTCLAVCLLPARLSALLGCWPYVRACKPYLYSRCNLLRAHLYQTHLYAAHCNCARVHARRAHLPACQHIRSRLFRLFSTCMPFLVPVLVSYPATCVLVPVSSNFSLHARTQLQWYSLSGLHISSRLLS